MVGNAEARPTPCFSASTVVPPESFFRFRPVLRTGDKKNKVILGRAT